MVAERSVFRPPPPPPGPAPPYCYPPLEPRPSESYIVSKSFEDGLVYVLCAAPLFIPFFFLGRTLLEEDHLLALIGPVIFGIFFFSLVFATLWAEHDREENKADFLLELERHSTKLK